MSNRHEEVTGPTPSGGESRDAENRLIEITTRIDLGGYFGGYDEGDQRLRFVYDYMGRRSEKTHEVHTSGNWVMQSGYPKWFIYDGWNVQLVLRPGSTYDPVTNPTDIVTERKYTWGLDLSGSFHGAGGIGGLLAAVETQGTSQTGDDVSYWYFYDANGNVGQLIDGTTPGTPVLAAHYEYDPYGNLLAAVDVDSSNYVNINPFRFSTKWLDYEIGGTALGTTSTGAVGPDGLYYYGYRYYSPSLGRWIKRDPIGEDGGSNLYCYVMSSSISLVDPVGLQALPYGMQSDKRRKSCCYRFKIKVDEKGYNYSSARKFFDSLGKDLGKQQQGKGEGGVGHTWVRLEGGAQEPVLEGGHSGETGNGAMNPSITDSRFLSYWDGLMTLANMSPSAASPMPTLTLADPANPIAWLHYLYEDGHWVRGSGPHDADRECSWCLSRSEYDTLKPILKAYDTDNYHPDLKMYGLTGRQCTSTAGALAEMVGINIDYIVKFDDVPASISFPGYGTVRLWTDSRYQKFELALPDKMADKMGKSSGKKPEYCKNF